MSRKLPRFEPVGLEERRALWVKYREQRDVQRLLRKRLGWAVSSCARE